MIRGRVSLKFPKIAHNFGNFFSAWSEAMKLNEKAHNFGMVQDQGMIQIPVYLAFIKSLTQYQ